MMPYFTLLRRGLQLATLSLLLLLGACSILPTPPELQVYLLPTQTQPTSANGQEVNTSLRVTQPNTSQFLNSSRIAVQLQGEEIAVYQDSRWSDPAPILLRNHLIQAFRTDGRIQAVSSDDDGLQADIELSGDLTAFQGMYRPDSSEVLIRFDARLIRTLDRRILASQRFEVRQPIVGHSMKEVVQAFGLANDQLSKQVIDWTIRQAAAGRDLTQVP